MQLLEIFRLDERNANITDVLRPYRDDPEMFISFVSIPKLGINPRSPYDTPLGIYAYPLKDIWDGGDYLSVPFMAKAPYVALFRGVGNIQDMAAYTQADFDRDVERLCSSPYVRTVVGEGPRDVLTGSIHYWSDEARFQTPIGRFWNITRCWSSMVAEDRHTKPAVAWNAMLRFLGYAGFADRQGTGLIHRNEPCQAMFLSINAVRLVQMIPNVSKKLAGDRMKFDDFSDMEWIISSLRADKEAERNLLYKLKEQWKLLIMSGQSENFAITGETCVLDAPMVVQQRLIKTLIALFPDQIIAMIDVMKEHPGFQNYKIAFSLLNCLQNVHCNPRIRFTFLKSDSIEFLAGIAGANAESVRDSFCKKLVTVTVDDMLRTSKGPYVEADFIRDVYKKFSPVMKQIKPYLTPETILGAREETFPF